MQYFWEKNCWENEDKHLRQLQQMPFRRVFPFIPQAPGLYILRGPRQIGKSSWLKTILSHCVKKDQSCFYLSCEGIEDHRELTLVLKSVERRSVILLDEVNFVRGWDRAIKHFIDSGYQGILIVTGSHAYDLKKGADHMPGRFGGGGEFYLLPMSFEEFTAARAQAGWQKKNRVEELVDYFKVGGFPAAVAESADSGAIPIKFMKTIWRWLAGDALKLGKNETYLEELIIQLGKTVTTPVSAQTLCSNTNIGSHNTVTEYLELLVSCFALRVCYAIDLDNGSYRFKKNRKFYFTDPLIFWLSQEMSGKIVEDSGLTKVAEQVAHEALSHKYKRLGYFSNEQGEIDFISPKNWALEVKWAPFAHNLSKAFLKNQSPAKIVWTQENFLLHWP